MYTIIVPELPEDNRPRTEAIGETEAEAAMVFTVLWNAQQLESNSTNRGAGGYFYTSFLYPMTSFKEVRDYIRNSYDVIPSMIVD